VKKIDAIPDWKEAGWDSAVLLEESDLPVTFESARKLIEFGRNHGAVVDEGAGELILIVKPGSTEQCGYAAQTVDQDLDLD